MCWKVYSLGDEAEDPRFPGLGESTRDIDHALTAPDQPTGTVALDMIVRPSSENKGFSRPLKGSVLK